MAKYPEAFSHIEQESRKGRTVDEWVIEAERLEEKYGELPNVQKLREIGRAGIWVVLKRYPERFSHIKQKWEGGRKVDEWVKEAEELDKEHGGVPPHKW